MRRSLLPLILLTEIVLFTIISGQRFESVPDFLLYFQSYGSDLLVQSAPALLLAFGMTLVLMTAGIDLSVASMVALVACVMSTFEGGTSFWWTAIPVGLCLAIALGAVNGVLIASLDVPPIIATLGTMIFYRGLCFVVMGDLENAPFMDVPVYEALGRVTGAGLVITLVYLIGGSYFHHSRWRREILMLGGNHVAARYAGISVSRRVIQVYSMVGFLAFLAALVFTARNSSISASSLSGLELKVIVAVVLGGTSVQGGRGSIIGTILGVLIVAVLEEGLRGAAIWGDRNLPFNISHLQYILLGLLLIFGVWNNTRVAIPARRQALPHTEM